MRRIDLLTLLMTTAFLQAHPQAPYHAVLFNGTSASQESRLIAMTIAGIVNRDSARLYLLNVYETWSYNRTDEQWRDLYRSRGNVVFDSIASILDLVNRFRPFIDGGVSYDPVRYFGNFPGQSFRWQAEYAALIGGLTNRIPVTASMASVLGVTLSDSIQITDTFDGDSSVWVPGRMELSGLPWNNASQPDSVRYRTLLNWGVQNLLPRCNPAKFYIREITDFAIQRKMFQVNLAGYDELDLYGMPSWRADILENVLTYLHVKNPSSIFHMYGWIQPEPMTQWFAFFGASFHETLLGNLSWHSSFPVAPRTYVPASHIDPATVPLENKHYIVFVGSEGDASNWVFGFQAGAWLSSQRGSVPVGWGWNLHLFNECPFVASYYYDTSTPNDGFLSVTSPLGFAYPDLWQNDVWNGARDSSHALMDRFSVHEVYGYKHYAGAGTMVFRGKTISNSFNFSRYGSFQSAIGATLAMLYDPLLSSQVPVTTYGALLFNHTGDGSWYGDASDLNVMAQRIITKVKTQPLPSFLLAGYQRLRQDDFASRSAPSDADISIPRLAQVVQLITADPVVGADIDVVTPEVFSVVMRRSIGWLDVAAQDERPSEFQLLQNYPNPFNPATRICYTVGRVVVPSGALLSGAEGPASSNVKLAVYDILGREVAVLVNEWKAPGSYDVRFNASGLASGVYLYRLTAGSFVSTKKMVLVR